MRIFSWLALSGALLLAGCHKKDNAAANQPSGSSEPAQATPGASAAPGSTTEPSTPLPPPSAAITTRAENQVREAVVGEADPFLTTQLRQFVTKRGRLPQSFNEFARQALDSVPNPPPGKKWAIDAGTQEVKAVAK